MLFATIAFSHLLQSCAPNIGPRTMTAIVRVESGANPLAVRDNTMDRAFYPKTVEEAIRLANYLLGKRHNLDLGISQVNSANLNGLGMTVRDAFNPCNNLHGGASILAGAYRRAVAQFGPGQYALRRAIGAYNTGSLFAGDRYISMILEAAGIRDTPVNVARVPNLDSESQAPANDQIPAQSPIVTAAVEPAVQVKPEDSPILVNWRRQSASMLVAGGQHLTHIPVQQMGMTHIPINQTQMTHIPVTSPGEQQGMSSEQGAQDGGPIVLRALPARAPAGLTPQQQLLQEAAAMQREH